MLSNRSMPSCSVIPVLGYPDLDEAIHWLSRAFGFTLRWKIAGDCAQMNASGGCVVLTGGDDPERIGRCSVMVRVESIDLHYEQLLAFGARALSGPADHVYGERQYRVQDLAGHVWTFSQSVADVNPEDWGATVGEL